MQGSTDRLTGEENGNGRGESGLEKHLEYRSFVE